MEKIIIGQTYNPRINVYDGNGDAVDLSGATVKWALKESATSAYPVVASMPVSGSADVGYATASVSDTITEQIPEGQYKEEFEITLLDGTVKKEQRDIVVVWGVISG